MYLGNFWYEIIRLDLYFMSGYPDPGFYHYVLVNFYMFSEFPYQVYRLFKPCLCFFMKRYVSHQLDTLSVDVLH